MQETLQQVFAIARSAWRFRWHGVVVAWVVGLVGWAWVAVMPNVYEANARVFIDTSSVLRPLLTDQIVAPDVTTRLMYVRQALLGSIYLARVAEEQNLYDQDSSAAQREAVINRLRMAIRIDAAPANEDDYGPNTSSIYSISYRHERPETAVAVVRTLLTSLKEDTHGANRRGADSAERFLDANILEYEGRLRDAETALAEFRRVNAGRLPGSEGSYFERMQRERDALEESRRSLRLALSTRDQLRLQLSGESPVVATDASALREPPPNSLDARIRDSQANLDRLLLQYTEKHPDVIAERETLARLQEQRNAQLRDLGIDNPDQELSALGSSPVYQAVRIRLNEVDAEIATLRADESDRERRLAELQGLINEVPEVEARLAQLNRDYNVIRDQYQTLTQSRETQDLSRKAEDADQVEFRELNPPQAGQGPVAPPRLFYIAAVFAAALGLGGALCYVRALIKPVFSTPQMLRAALGLPVLGTVSRVTVSAEVRARRRLALLSFSAAMAGLFMIFLILGLIELSGPGINSLLAAS